ncbi:MAG: hypothetical protein Q9199_006981 [Rusavskia elegans]
MPGIQEVFDGTTQKSPEHTQIELEHQSSYDRDRDELARLGKKQVLKVRGRKTTNGHDTDHDVAEFRLHVNAWVLLYHHGNMGGHVGKSSGGPAGLIYGFLFVWVGTLCVFTTLGELASM